MPLRKMDDDRATGGERLGQSCYRLEQVCYRLVQSSYRLEHRCNRLAPAIAWRRSAIAYVTGAIGCCNGSQRGTLFAMRLKPLLNIRFRKENIDIYLE